jgi:hypothetical protein
MAFSSKPFSERAPARAFAPPNSNAFGMGFSGPTVTKKNTPTCGVFFLVGAEGLEPPTLSV